MLHHRWFEPILLAPERPPRVGGLATPLGVYMTTGHLRAGVGDASLFLTGVVMTLLLWGVLWLLTGLEWLIGTHLPNAALFLIVTLSFLTSLRFSPLAGYHAAEHQTIAAIERGLPLVPAVVKAMPRVHPRCGSNIVAIAILAQGLIQVLAPWLEWDPYMALAVLTIVIGLVLLGWRPLGFYLQALFTTRPASERQIVSGISAGEELLKRYPIYRDYRASWWRRVWNFGILQIICGWLVTQNLLELAGWW